MNAKSTKFLWVSFLIVAMLLLSGCTANLVTEINSDGSGTWGMEYIMTVDELESYGYTLTDSFCADDLESDLSDMPPGTSMRQEQNGDEVSCIFEASFDNLEGLRTIYVDMDSTVNSLEFRDNKFYYDVDVDMGSTDTMGFMIYWIVKMPGTVTETNATTQEGNTLTWEAPTEGILNAYATSSVGGLSSTWWWVIGIGSLCCCFVIIAAVVVLIIVLNKKKKNKAAAPAAPAAPAV
jgi:hypothetical protein